ncbi:MAG: DUF4112 domain-containing protein [Chitinophagales bacterium]
MSGVQATIDKKPLPVQFQKISKLVTLMDTAFRIPGTKIKFGLDPVIGLFPIVGDLIDYSISAYLLIAMLRNGASGKAVMKMLGNITLDGIIGLVPIFGRFFDVFYKANRRNLILAVEHFEEGKHQGSAKPYIIAVLGVLALIFILLGVLSVYILKYAWHYLNAHNIMF